MVGWNSFAKQVLQKEGIALKTDRPHLEMFQAPKKIVLLPIGAIEQHGPRLPLDTDLRIAEFLADRLENGL